MVQTSGEPVVDRIIAALAERKVRHLLIGGHASIIHGVPRATTDIDITILISPSNPKRCIDALKGLGM